VPVPDPGLGLTARQSLEIRTAGEPCHGCHVQHEPGRLGLEIFDAVGALRSTDNGKAIDPSGVLPGDIKFANTSELLDESAQGRPLWQLRDQEDAHLRAGAWDDRLVRSGIDRRSGAPNSRRTDTRCGNPPPADRAKQPVHQFARPRGGVAMTGHRTARRISRPRSSARDGRRGAGPPLVGADVPPAGARGRPEARRCARCSSTFPPVTRTAIG